MVSVSTGFVSNVDADDFRFGAKPVLFVEGGDAGAFDPVTLSELLKQIVRIEPLGSSFYISSVANALYPSHPQYFFLIDRDHHSDEFIEQCWNDFPLSNTRNLIVWRLREIESYFLDAGLLTLSIHCVGTKDEVRKKIFGCARDRMYFDVSNSTIVRLREEMKTTWVKKFINPLSFPSEDIAIKNLLERNDSTFGCCLYS